MNKSSYILLFLILLMSSGIQAQIDSIKNQIPKDTVTTLKAKTIIKEAVVQLEDTLNTKVFKPDPLKVVWMAVILPGAGQIMNRKYWKLPLVYGGFVGCAFAISLNSGLYQTYNTAYFDILHYQSDNSYKSIVDKNPGAVSFVQLLTKRYGTIDLNTYIADYTSQLQAAQAASRRYRDLSIIVTIGFYALTIVDAYVDAQLYDFDISPNLSMHISPALMENRYGLNNTLGLQCSISLK